MPWLLLLLAAGALVVAFTTKSMALAIVCLLAALLLVIAGTMGLLASRIGSRTRDDSMMIDPQALRHLRDQAEARRNVPAPPDGDGAR